MLEDGTESSALGAADNFGAIDMDDIVGVAAEETEEVFGGDLGGCCQWVGLRAGLSEGFAAEAAVGIALIEEKNEG